MLNGLAFTHFLLMVCESRFRFPHFVRLRFNITVAIQDVKLMDACICTLSHCVDSSLFKQISPSTRAHIIQLPKQYVGKDAEQSEDDKEDDKKGDNEGDKLVVGD
jgi:hypothetical protein